MGDLGGNLFKGDDDNQRKNDYHRMNIDEDSNYSEDEDDEFVVDQKGKSIKKKKTNKHQIIDQNISLANEIFGSDLQYFRSKNKKINDDNEYDEDDKKDEVRIDEIFEKPELSAVYATREDKIIISSD